MTPWRRRLADLCQLIVQADQNYFEPDLFRLNVNNAIQTARTVTFLIQKNKSSIPEFDLWYKENLLDRIKGDRVMEWLKESRNHIEKEGDLDVNSECNLETIFSYTDPGPKMSLKHEGQLFIGTKRLLRTIRKIFPTGVFRDSAIAIDRRWVATSLPDFELTDALHYGYSELERVVDSLDKHLGSEGGVVMPLSRSMRGSSSRRAYLKSEDGQIYSFAHASTNVTLPDVAALEERYDVDAFASAFRTTGDLSTAIERFSELASALYTKDGYHITIGFVLGSEGRILHMLQPQFDDHTDKMIFWTELAHVARINKEVSAVIFTSEIWFRSADGFPQKRVSQLDITGEGLQIVAADRDKCFVKTIPVVSDEAGKRLDIGSAELTTDVLPNFIVPLRKVWETRQK